MMIPNLFPPPFSEEMGEENLFQCNGMCLGKGSADIPGCKQRWGDLTYFNFEL